MPAPKKNPAVVAAIATALKVAKAAKAAKTVSSVAKKPVVKVQPKSSVKAEPMSNVKQRRSVVTEGIRQGRNKAESEYLKNAKSGKIAREKAEDIKSRVGTATKKPTVKIKTGSPWDKAGQKMSSSPKFK